MLDGSGKADIQADIARNDPSQNRSRSDNVRQESGIAGARPPQQLEQVSSARMMVGRRRSAIEYAVLTGHFRLIRIKKQPPEELCKT